MPVFAIGAAVVAVTVAVATLETFAIIAAVGATIAAIGAVTGSKELTIAGGIVGAIGGIGALASSAGIFGSAASSLSEVAAGTTAAETASPFGAAGGIDSEIAQWSSYGAGAAGGGMAGAPTVGGAMPSVDTSMDVVDTVTGNVSTAREPLSSVAANAASPDVNPAMATDAGVPNTQMGGQEMADASGKVLQGDAGTVNPPTAPQAPAAPGVDPKTGSILQGGQGVPGNPVTGAIAPNGTSAPAYSAESLINAPNSSGVGIVRGATTIPASATSPMNFPNQPSIFSNIMDTIGKPGVGTLASGVVQAGMSFLSGATNGLTPAQIAALNAQAEANQAAANMSRMQQANMSGNLPVASRTPLVRQPRVTGAPQGLINTPPQGAPA